MLAGLTDRIGFGLRRPFLYMTPKVPPREGTRPTTSCRPGPLTRRRGFMSSGIARRSAVKPNLSRLFQIALLVITWLDFMTHTPRQNPTVSRTAYEPGLLRI